MILAVDPGKDKCGLAVLDPSGYLLEKRVFSRQEISSLIPAYLAKYGVSSLVVGQSSSGKEIEKELSKLELRTNLFFASEKYTSLEARKRYWEENKPNGLWRFVPASLRVPPEPVDDYAAVIIGLRFLNKI